MNGWQKILKEMYDKLKEGSSSKSKINFKIAGDVTQINCDLIGEILLNTDCLSYVKYIEEILDVNIIFI